MKRSSRRAATSVVVTVAVAVLSASCRKAGEDAPAGAEPATWSVTAWTDHFEVFPEVEPLIAGRSASAHTHVTILSGFSPMREGTVSAVLRRGSEVQEFAGVFRRDGIYGIDIKPAREGEYDLLFRIKTKGLAEDVPAGKVRVGTAADPGGLIAPPAPPNGPAPPAVADSAELSFLKEQQWKTPFATAWVQQGQVPAGAAGTARVRAPGGGIVLLTAPVDGVVRESPWPHVGAGVGPGSVVFRVVPSVTQERTLADLQAEVAALESERSVAQARLERLRELLKVEATSNAEVERAESHFDGLRARAAASRKNFSSAQSARGGRRSAAESLPVISAWAGQVAAVLVSPGQVVSAGTALGRLVKPRPVWLEVALRPDDAARVGSRVEGVVVRRAADAQPIVLPAQGIRVIGRSPELDPQTGTVTVIVEVPLSATELPLGSAVEAEVLLAGGETAVIVPESALVDDGGAMVVYVQLSGEGFARREIKVGARRGGAVAAGGLNPGERLVTRGGAALRRASLLSTGAPEGHVH
jgi:cobalt-zinc-cadmium efflux system membrane fusion protein